MYRYFDLAQLRLMLVSRGKGKGQDRARPASIIEKAYPLYGSGSGYLEEAINLYL